MKRSNPVDTRTLREKLVAVLYHCNVSGAVRRELLIPLLRQWQADHPEGIAVNRRYCPQMYQDADLRYLVAKGQAKLVRRQQTRRTSYTYLQLL